jgi:hypothetical protein
MTSVTGEWDDPGQPTTNISADAAAADYLPADAVADYRYADAVADYQDADDDSGAESRAVEPTEPDGQAERIEVLLDRDEVVIVPQTVESTEPDRQAEQTDLWPDPGQPTAESGA